MHWRKRDLRKAAIAIVGMLLLLLFMVWVPVSMASSREGMLGFAGPVTATVQATPTVDLTVTALVKDQLKQQDENLRRENSFPWTLLNAIGGSIGALLLATAAFITAVIGFRQWLGNRKDEQKKQAEDRFKSIVEGLGGKSAETKLASAVLLRTFLGPDYKEFYTQVFDLAVANLRPHKHTDSGTTKSSDLSKEESASNSSIDIAEPPDSLTQALITAFREAFPRARKEQRKQLIEQKAQFKSRFLDAAEIQLDKAFLYGADLSEAWMPRASLRKADLTVASLNQIQLENADLTDAQLGGATLTGAYLSGAHLDRAVLENVNLTGANLSGANLSGANLRHAVLTETNLSGTNLTKAILEDADLNSAVLENTDFSGADLRRAKLLGTKPKRAKFTGANLESAEPSNIISLSSEEAPS